MKKRWKIILEYLAGILLLSEVLIIAWCLPGWYGKWQDSEMMNQVTLSKREGISFLDMESLDLVGRLKILCDTDMFQWNEKYLKYYHIKSEEMISLDMLEKCRNTMKIWCEAELLPEKCTSWIDEKYLVLSSEHYIYTDTAALPVNVMIFEPETNDRVVLVMDQEHNFFYYASLSGTYAEDVMVHELGYESLKDMMISASEKKTHNKTTKDISTGYSAVCGAESGSMTGSPDELECSVQLDFDTFHVTAWRDVIQNDAGSGMAIVFGTQRWYEFVNSFMGALGNWESVVTTDYWMYSMFSMTNAGAVDSVE